MRRRESFIPRRLPRASTTFSVNVTPSATRLNLPSRGANYRYPREHEKYESICEKRSCHRWPIDDGNNADDDVINNGHRGVISPCGAWHDILYFANQGVNAIWLPPQRISLSVYPSLSLSLSLSSQTAVINSGILRFADDHHAPWGLSTLIE